MNTAGIKSLIQKIRGTQPEIAHVLEEMLSMITAESEPAELANNTYLKGRNSKGNLMNIIGIDNGDRIVISPNSQATNEGRYQLYIPIITVSEIPAFNKDRAGLLAIDISSNYLVFFTQTNRYRILGATF